MHFLANFLSPRSDELKQAIEAQNNLKTGLALPLQFFSFCPISDLIQSILFFPIFVSLGYDLIMTRFPVIFGRTDFFIPFFQLVCQMIS